MAHSPTFLFISNPASKESSSKCRKRRSRSTSAAAGLCPEFWACKTGQILRITNSDPVNHNIHALAQVNREWNHSQPPEEGSIDRKFLKPEVMIPLKCNIHGWMHAYVGVVDIPILR